MPGEDLTTAVRQATHGMNRSAIRRVTGLSARTIRDILEGVDRRYGDAVLDKLDALPGWTPGTGRRIFQGTPPAAQSAAAVTELAALHDELAALARRVAMLEESPGWAAELVAACRLLDPEDRDALMAMARRLGRRRL
jgi:hypothetical protein